MNKNRTSEEICVCMGSSCFARGNKRNLEVVQAFVKEHWLGTGVRVIGCLCMDQCRQGPNVRIGKTLYHGVDHNSCLDLMRKHFR